MKTISHTEMLSLWKQGLRNGAIRRLHCLKRGLFSAALEYSKIVGRIVNPKLLEIIEGVADHIQNSISRKIFRFGLTRVSALKGNSKVMRAFPSLKSWMDKDIYIFWLGTELFEERRRWLLIWN